jgi:hypothetical protein
LLFGDDHVSTARTSLMRRVALSRHDNGIVSDDINRIRHLSYQERRDQWPDATLVMDRRVQGNVKCMTEKLELERHAADISYVAPNLQVDMEVVGY